ncbi:UNVERIFIED_CONTAM: hypothetical protein BJ099_112173 [Lysinibacillus xylanilyticus]|uniref:hypothetical protein n=1 Tax=Lysinibacillus xylanilyticus TaxID=582475 RepID=UPI000A51499F|nr:hypothetical protein [Lysinibacillus xylanilyticus]
MNDVQTRILLPAWILKNAEDNDKISRLLLECKTKLVISCAYPGNFFYFLT